MNCWHCFHHKKNIDKDSAWRAQNLETAENPVYKLVNITQTGELLKLYEEEGPRAVRRRCIDRISPYLYNQGVDSDVIKHEQYSKWRFRIMEGQTWEERFADVYKESQAERDVAVSGYLPVGSSFEDYTNDGIINFTDHEACWDLEFRGAVGETALHLCYLNNTPIHIEIAKILLDLYPKLVLDIYEAEEYYGESALHFAVVHGNLDSVRLLVEKGANVNQRATGRFFLPEDQKSIPRAAITNYEGDAYYGEYPLAFAACLGHESIYDYLISQGADPNVQDSFGNTVLHMAVIKNKPSMYSYAARHPVTKADHWKLNGLRTEHHVAGGGGLTPLALANRLGRHEVFNEIMELHKLELWRFSNVNCSIYPIHAVDTIGPNGSMNWNSSLMITLNGETEEHVDLLQTGVLRQLLDEKWKTFVRRRFFLRLAILIFHLIVLSISVVLRPKSQPQLLNTKNDSVRLVFEIFTLIACLMVIVMQVQEMKFLGFYFSFASLKNAPFKAIYLIGCFLQLLMIPLRFASLAYLDNNEKLASLQIGEETLLILALPMSWSMILFFAKVTFLIGPLMNILFIYIRRDLLPFLIIVAVVYIAFAASFHEMYKTIPSDQNVTTFGTPYGSLMTLFQFTLGEFEYDEFKETVYPILTMIVFILFMFIMPILLLNMLIAMMATTFEKIIKKSEKDWIHQWAKIIIVLERTFSDTELLKFQRMYSVKIENPSDILKGLYHGVDEVDIRGLMVIKKASKTKSKQRKDAVKNWKRTAKDVLNRIKEIKEFNPDPMLEIDFGVVFPEVDIYSEADPLTYRRHVRGSSHGSQDLAAAVSQMADALAPIRT